MQRNIFTESIQLPLLLQQRRFNMADVFDSMIFDRECYFLKNFLRILNYCNNYEMVDVFLYCEEIG